MNWKGDGSVCSRRDFLKYLALLLASGAYAAPRPPQADEETAGAGRLLINNAPKGFYGEPDSVVRTPPGSVRVLDLGSGASGEVPVPFFGHTLTQDPARPLSVATFEQFGKRGAVIDLKDLRCAAVVEAAADNTFFGHAAIGSDKNACFTSEHDHRKDRGIISVRDPRSLKILGEFASAGRHPHDCRLIDGDKTIVVVNQGGPSNVSWIDARSGKLLNKITCGRDAGSSFSHLDLSHDLWLCATQRNHRKSGQAVVISPEGKTFELPNPPEGAGAGGILSVAFLGRSGLVAATFPEAGLVRAWEYKTRAFVCAVRIPQAKGIVWDSGPAAIVSSGSERTLHRFTVDPRRKTADGGPFNAKFGGAGAHLVRIST